MKYFLSNHYLLAALGDLGSDTVFSALTGDFLFFFDFLDPSSIFDIKYQIDPTTTAAKIPIYAYLADEGISEVENPKNLIENYSSAGVSCSAYFSSLLTCIS